jgi:hypothetical protein
MEVPTKTGHLRELKGTTMIVSFHRLTFSPHRDLSTYSPPIDSLAEPGLFLSALLLVVMQILAKLALAMITYYTHVAI